MKQTSLKVGDVYRLKTEIGFRVWKLVGIHLGIVGQEDLVSLMALDQKNGDAFGKQEDIMTFPLAIFEASKLERC